MYLILIIIIFIFILFILIVLPVLLIMILISSINKKGKMGINLNQVNCPDCNEKMPAFRAPRNFRQILFGGWTCTKCGCEMDKWGTKII